MGALPTSVRGVAEVGSGLLGVEEDTVNGGLTLSSEFRVEFTCRCGVGTGELAASLGSM